MAERRISAVNMPSRQQRRAAERARRKALKRQGRALGPAAALASGAALGLCLARPAHAATFTVTNLNDAGAGSLRQAIIDANAAATDDIIVFQSGLTGTITLTTGELDITDAVDIQGPGSNVITVDGNNASRIFDVGPVVSGDDVRISDLTLTQGSAGGDGGAVRSNDADLTLRRMVITGNTASGDGGGVYADDRDLTIEDCLITGNTADSDGGGVYVDDCNNVNIRRTRITGNAAGSEGGGIYFDDHDEPAVIECSTISGNTASSDGGGVYVGEGIDDSVTIRDSTISGNRATDGGGLYDGTDGGFNEFFVVENSTISGNVATGLGGGIYSYGYTYDSEIRHSTIAGNTASDGGGIYMYGYAGYELDLIMSLVGNNAAPSGPDLGGDGTFRASFSLVENTAGANITNAGGNVFGQDPNIGPLANNGGPTLTHGLLPGSPALDAGDPAFAPPPNSDQRGCGSGFPRVLNGRIDIGAFEGTVTAGAVPAPAVGGFGQMLVAGLLSVIGWLRLRRRKKSIAAAATALALGALAAGPAQAGQTTYYGIISNTQTSGGQTVLQLQNGQTVQAPSSLIRYKDQRSPAPANGPMTASSTIGQAAAIKVKQRRDGTVKKVKVFIFDSVEEAASEAADD